MEKRRVYRTLMCIGSGVGSTGIGNAEWTVTPLGPLLQSVLTGGRDDRLRVIFYGMDGFYSSVPLEVALDQDSFLAFEMNGASLPIRHGYPLRVLLPGKYGMKQPRWLERITVTDRNELGYWEKRGWSDDCEVKMTARIDSAKELAKRNWLVKGVAYCGRSAVGCVEVSDDQGVTWSLARLTREALRNAWCTWEFEWHPRVRGECVLTVRVSGSQGEQQIQRYSGSFPSGSTGLHRVIVRV